LEATAMTNEATGRQDDAGRQSEPGVEQEAGGDYSGNAAAETPDSGVVPTVDATAGGASGDDSGDQSGDAEADRIAADAGRGAPEPPD
jgi:hypothetical protein